MKISNHDFRLFSNLIHKSTGLKLTNNKKELLIARVSKILRRKNIPSYKIYYRLIVDDTSGESLAELIDAITTNKTDFFREIKHFEFLEKKLIPECMEKYKKEKKLDIWSAGCSTGEEVYSLLICCLETSQNELCKWNFYITGTDISNKVLKLAEQGIYSKEKLANLNPFILNKYFLKGQNKCSGLYKFKDEFRNYIKFMYVNLLDDLHFDKSFNIIFCRNVLIYFDKELQTKIINKFYEKLQPKGYLFLGHSESLIGIKHHFKYIEPTIYQKT